jgi:hypothetical protein
VQEIDHVSQGDTEEDDPNIVRHQITLSRNPSGPSIIVQADTQIKSGAAAVQKHSAIHEDVITVTPVEPAETPTTSNATPSHWRGVSLAACRASVPRIWHVVSSLCLAILEQLAEASVAVAKTLGLGTINVWLITTDQARVVVVVSYTGSPRSLQEISKIGELVRKYRLKTCNLEKNQGGRKEKHKV